MNPYNVNYYSPAPGMVYLQPNMYQQYQYMPLAPQPPPPPPPSSPIMGPYNMFSQPLNVQVPWPQYQMQPPAPPGRIPIEFLLNPDIQEQATLEPLWKRIQHESKISTSSSSLDAIRQTPDQAVITSPVLSSSPKLDVSVTANPSVSTTKDKKRQAWTAEQDAILIHAVNKYGAKNWGHIASFIPGRTSDNARLRYMYFLRYSQDRERQFTEEEDAMILKEAQGDRQWKRVGVEIGRSCSAVRNRHDVIRRRAIRKDKKAARIRESKEQIKLKLKVFERMDSDIRDEYF